MLVVNLFVYSTHIHDFDGFEASAIDRPHKIVSHFFGWFPFQ